MFHSNSLSFYALYFVVYIIAPVYLIYCFFFVQTSLDGVKKSFFLLFANNFIVFLLIITLECSRIVRLNSKLHRKCMQVFMQQQKFVSFNVKENLKNDQLMANSKHIRSIGFRLLNNYHIDGNMFQMVSGNYLLNVTSQN